MLSEGVTSVTMFNRGFTWMRRVRIPIYAVGTIAAVMATYPGGVGAAYENASEISRLNAEMEQLHLERARMEQESVLVANRIAVKEGLVEDLIRGRTTLPEVCAEFARLNKDDPCQAIVVQQVYPGAGEQESNARIVLGYAEVRCVNDSTREHVMENLHCQFRGMMEEAQD
jgi:hypothetical protein